MARGRDDPHRTLVHDDVIDMAKTRPPAVHSTWCGAITPLCSRATGSTMQAVSVALASATSPCRSAVSLTQMMGKANCCSRRIGKIGVTEAITWSWSTAKPRVSSRLRALGAIELGAFEAAESGSRLCLNSASRPVDRRILDFTVARENSAEAVGNDLRRQGHAALSTRWNPPSQERPAWSSRPRRRELRSVPFAKILQILHRHAVSSARRNARKTSPARAREAISGFSDSSYQRGCFRSPSSHLPDH